MVFSGCKCNDFQARELFVLLPRPAVKWGLRQGSAQRLRPELRVRVKHLKAKGVLRHATVKHLISD